MGWLAAATSGSPTLVTLATKYGISKCWNLLDISIGREDTPRMCLIIPCDVTACRGKLYEESAWRRMLLLIDKDRLGARTSLESYPLCELVSW
ncbi:hypothetical protein AVEN_25678-1 [Araneus ventricosus]|uniref:Uncharacterized protein n=1 Tax=Araneus ventricosus TaxID=182803 RepID=A0A4Y2NNX0_ARAVE|nr:hypothetical protein AVEN_25678-1 [Araneus ventricosus]